REQFFNSKTSQGSPHNPLNVNGVNGSIANTYAYAFSNENTLTYKKSFGEHNLTAMGLFGVNGSKSLSNGYAGRLLPNENLGMNGLDQGVIYNPGSSSSENSMVSYAARVDYTFASKYLLTLPIAQMLPLSFKIHGVISQEQPQGGTWIRKSFLNGHSPISQLSKSEEVTEVPGTTGWETIRAFLV